MMKKPYHQAYKSPLITSEPSSSLSKTGYKSIASRRAFTVADQHRNSTPEMSEAIKLKSPKNENPLNQNLKNNAIPPRTVNERLMAKVWTEIFNLEDISVTDNFFSYGRDSFLAMRVIERIRKVFGVNISVQALFKDPTIAGMTAAVLKDQSSR